MWQSTFTCKIPQQDGKQDNPHVTRSIPLSLRAIYLADDRSINLHFSTLFVHLNTVRVFISRMYELDQKARPFYD